MAWEPTIAIFSLLVSLVAIGLVIYTHLRSHRSGALGSNLVALAALEAELAKNPRLFRLHSVTDQELADLKNMGIDADDLAYLIANFHIGSVYYSVIGLAPNFSPFSEERDPYRFYMLKAPEVRAAWPILKRFLDSIPYKERIHCTIVDLENAETHGSRTS